MQKKRGRFRFFFYILINLLTCTCNPSPQTRNTYIIQTKLSKLALIITIQISLGKILDCWTNYVQV